MLSGPGRPSATGWRCRHGELLRGQDVVWLGYPGGILGQLHRTVRMELGVRSRNNERLGGEDVVRRLPHRRQMIANLPDR